jgi:hypothetical protein
MLSCSISSWDLIKCPYFAETTERGDRGWNQAERQGEDIVTLRITLISLRTFGFLRGFFEDYIFEDYNRCMVKYLSFHNSTFFLKISFNVNGKVTVWHTPCWTLASQGPWPRRKGCIWNRVRVDNMQGFVRAGYYHWKVNLVKEPHWELLYHFL